jgi:hypothetical protein
MYYVLLLEMIVQPMNEQMLSLTTIVHTQFGQ